MTNYIVRRTLQAIPLLLLISMIAFGITHAIGDPLSVYAEEATLTREDVERLRAQHGLDQPLPIRYVTWLGGIVTGDWGQSHHTREDVTAMVWRHLPNTLVLVGISYTLIITFGILLGITTALRQYSVYDHVVTGISFIGIALPGFWLGLMLIIVFSVYFRHAGLPYFPVGGMYDLRAGPSVQQVIWHAILPSVTLSAVITARYIRYIRAAMLEQIQLDYVRTARAKGLSGTKVMTRHVFKNVLIPVITLGALDIPVLLSGTIVIEAVFSWPGMGRLFWTAAERADMPVLMAVLLFVATLTVLFNLMADILYAVVDPRIKYS